MLTVFCWDISAQEIKPLKRVQGTAVEIGGYIEVPEGTEHCQPRECSWWERLRREANTLQAKGDKHAKRRFIELLREGVERSYRVPLLDRPPQKLASGPLPPAKKVWDWMENGTVELLVEVRADASIGDVFFLKQMNSVLDQLCILEARDSIYLPAVKDRVFVTERIKGGLTFVLAPAPGVANRRRPT